MNECVSIHTYVQAYIHMYKHTYICTSIHTYVQAYIHICTQTHLTQKLGACLNANIRIKVYVALTDAVYCDLSILQRGRSPAVLDVEPVICM